MAKKDPINFIIDQPMGMVLLNPTNENFDMQYAGLSFTIQAGEKKMLTPSAANHVLNAFTPRGLTYLPYGADEEKFAREGKKRNEDFKRRQVADFNVRNENRKNMGMGYLPPSQKMKEYAAELGVELMQPYAARDLERVKINEQTSEIEALRKSNAELLEKFNQLMATLTEKKAETPKTPKENVIEKPFVCDFPGCTASFAEKIALIGHKRSHQ